MRSCLTCLAFCCLLLSKTANGLLNLLTLVYKHTENLKLVVNTEKDKSEVMSPIGDAGDKWNIIDDSGTTVLSLTQVV